MLYAPNEGQRPVLNLAKLPYIRVNLPSETTARQINKRSILIKDIIDELGEAPTFERLIEHGLNRPKLAELADKKFMFKIEGLGRSISLQEQIKIINMFDATDL